uniref:Uncharacterized protein n=1 Tax=Arundo donax TaxID=35708 RepID=A0A0A8ZU11_ARUDO
MEMTTIYKLICKGTCLLEVKETKLSPHIK